MPILSFISFDHGYFKGAYTVSNHPYLDHLQVTSVDPAQTLVQVRSDEEIAIDLRAAIDSDASLAALDERLRDSPIRRTSRIFVNPVAWRDMPQHGRTPGRHRPHHLFVRISIDFFADTPAYCQPDAKGDISYYVALALDDVGRFRAWVDGWSFDFDSGFWCVKSIEDALDTVVPHCVDLTQGLVDQALSTVQGLPFQALYLLPGSGTRAPGAHQGTCDNGAALALIPVRGECP